MEHRYRGETEAGNRRAARERTIGDSEPGDHRGGNSTGCRCEVPAICALHEPESCGDAKRGVYNAGALWRSHEVNDCDGGDRTGHRLREFSELDARAIYGTTARICNAIGAGGE